MLGGASRPSCTSGSITLANRRTQPWNRTTSCVWHASLLAIGCLSNPAEACLTFCLMYTWVLSAGATQEITLSGAFVPTYAGLSVKPTPTNMKEEKGRFHEI